MLADCVAVGAGGALGAIFRYLLSMVPLQTRIPLTTLCINVAGAFVIGLVAAYSAKIPELDPRMLKFIQVGLCGGFTTFSSFSLEVVRLLQNGRYFAAFSYMVLSVVLCVSAAFGAYSAASALKP